MTKRELIEALAPFRDDQEIVMDVGLGMCHSDRNILTIDEVGDYHPDTGLVFLNAAKPWEG